MLERYSQFEYDHPRLLWGGVFIGCFILAFIFTLGFQHVTPNLAIQNESARSLISTSTQIQSTILAIVISLTILAVEMTASKYSPRVIEIYKKNIALWVFLFSYIFSIVIGSIFLTFIDSPVFPLSTTSGTIFLLVLGILLIFMLVPYVLSTLDSLNTERIIKRLAPLIDTKTINPQIDPFQSIFDVIYGAIRINDFTTMSTGLICAEERFKEIIRGVPQNSQTDYVAFRFFDDLKRCGFLLIEKKEEKYAFEIVTRLNTISNWAFEEQNTLVLHRSCTAIEETGIKACESGLVSVSNHALTTLKEIAEKIENVDGLSRDEQVTRKWSCALFCYVEAIGNIGKTAIQTHVPSPSGTAINHLNNLSRTTIEKQLSFEDDFIFKRISDIIIESIQQKDATLTDSLLEVMQFLGGYSLTQNNIPETSRVLNELKNIGKFAAYKENGPVLVKVVNAIRYIAISAIEKGQNDIGRDAVRCSVKFQLIFPRFFKNMSEIRFYDYNITNSTTTTDEEFDIAEQYEYMLLEEYMHPPEFFPDDFDYDDKSIVISL